jgi:hypothetical protein
LVLRELRERFLLGHYEGLREKAAQAEIFCCDFFCGGAEAPPFQGKTGKLKAIEAGPSLRFGMTILLIWAS